MKKASIIPLLKFDDPRGPFKIQTIKELKERQEDVGGAVHSHDYYEIVWVIKGMGKLHVDMQEYLIENNMIFCLKPHQAHRFVVDANMEGFVFSFTDDFFNVGVYEFDISSEASLQQLFSEHRPVLIQKVIEEEIMDVSLKMIKEYNHHYPFKCQLLKRYFKIFLILLSRQCEEVVGSVNETKESKLIKRFMELVDKNFREEKMAAGYAALLSVTANYLSKTVKQQTGFSVGHHIRQRVVLEAKRMASYSDSGMKEIAYELGFFDSAHFSRFFKSVAGTNFTDFKKEMFKSVIFTSFNRA
jgi:YesN/AraC family two-component response regulator